MTEQVHYRIEKRLVKRAKKICADLGITPTQAVSMFFAQLARNQGLPFRPTTTKEPLVSVERRNRILRDLDDAKDW
jgi:addiction module RelB/DinJ family antitoxin